MVKFTVRTSISSGCPHVSAFTPRTVFYVRGGKNPSMRTNTTSVQTQCIHVDATQRPHGHSASVRTHSLPLSHPSPPLPPASRPSPGPCGCRLLSAQMLEKKFIIIIIFYYFGSCCRLEMKEKNFGFRFSVFNLQDPQDPQDPQAPRAPRALQAKPQEEEGFFGLVPLVTHPSSNPLLGGLTPKFLSLSLHSL
jgi:hypothetical protein